MPYLRLSARRLRSLQRSSREHRMFHGAAQLFVAADRVPFVGPALPRLVLRRFRCQFGRHVKARGRLNKRTLDGSFASSKFYGLEICTGRGSLGVWETSARSYAEKGSSTFKHIE